ncbi:MAG: SAM-dependent methyltransferase [Promethearchaeota archaeon CR_4]|nr:MAG: SAM-dependent methyltransferase [Candidatus Lokiarchaeota archaeon CR_4]
MKLNLGCGIFYKPGYVNVDKFEPAVADKIADICQLHYEENSVDEIEASHILEHFDCLQIPYILSEWFRVLKPGGQIFLETPHLRKTVEKIHRAPLGKQLNTLRFLFGIDLLGNVHKMGFTPAILQKLLKSIGFCKVKNLRPQRFTHEQGLRIKAEKPVLLSKSDKVAFLVSFRTKIMNTFPNPNTLFLETIENNVMGPLNKLLPTDVEKYFTPANVVKLLANLALLHPQIALVFNSLFDSKKMEGINLAILHFLLEKNSPALFLVNWMHWKKSTTPLFFSLSKFYAHWVKRIEESIGMKEVNAREFQYLLAGEGAERAEYFSPEMISLQAMKVFNQGIKHFSLQNFAQAKLSFLRAVQLEPTNGLNYWNLARIFIQFNAGGEKVEGYFHLAIRNVKNRKLRKKIRRELEEYHTSGKSSLQPIQILT